VISPPSAGKNNTERVKGARLVWALVLILMETWFSKAWIFFGSSSSPSER
jgi:hypothetical protein